MMRYRNCGEPKVRVYPLVCTVQIPTTPLASGVLCVFFKPLPVPLLFRINNPHVTGQTRASAHGVIPANVRCVRRVRSKGASRTARPIACA